MAKLAYRPEIDGLRGISVMGVVLYHGGLGFTGGFVGVDVFFVISGFLITLIIMKDIEAGTFTLGSFWARRIRRIMPAVSVMALLVLVVGYFLLDPYAFVELSKSLVAQSVILSNVYFWRALSSYYAQLADYSPLLHTWSLAVEEQFYLFFPFFMLLVCRYFRRHVLSILVGVAVVSLLLSFYSISRYKSSTFFLLPPRAWELLAGSLVAMVQGRIHLSRGVAEFVSFAGLCMILLAMLSFDASTPFPGPYALLPVMGAVGFIVGCTGYLTRAGQLLAIKPLVFVGLISYSLYLWHWPVFSFASIVLVDLDLGMRLVLLLVSVMLAMLSWRFVETPFRGKKLLPCNRSAYKFGLVTTGVLLIASVTILQRDGMPDRFSEQELLLADDAWGSEILPYGERAIDALSMGRSDRQPDFVLWGDSHARAISYCVGKKAEGEGLVGEAYLASGILPIPHLWHPSKSGNPKAPDLAFNQTVFELIVERKVPHVILVGRWTAYCDGPNRTEISEGEGLLDMLVTDNSSVEASMNTPELSKESISRQLGKMIDELTALGIRVWLLNQVPESNDMTIARRLFTRHRYPEISGPVESKVSLDDHRRREESFMAVLSGIDSPLFTVLDSSSLFFDNAENILDTHSERSHYRDDDHLSHYGVERFLGPIFEGVFAEIKKSKIKGAVGKLREAGVGMVAVD